MTQPSSEDLFRALDATWRAAQFMKRGPWTLREGRGGGQRVSAATTDREVSIGEIADAERAMVAWEQTPLFMIKPRDVALDRQLEGLGYSVKDPVTAYIADIKDVAETFGSAKNFPTWPPLSIQTEMWLDGGIGSERIDVMSRATGEKTSLLARWKDLPAGTGFAAIDRQIAMVHALEVSPGARRMGVGKQLMQAAAHWALERQALWICVMVTDANGPANALYRSLGMTIAATYHYRVKDKEH